MMMPREEQPLQSIPLLFRFALALLQTLMTISGLAALNIDLHQLWDQLASVYVQPHPPDLRHSLGLGFVALNLAIVGLSIAVATTGWFIALLAISDMLLLIGVTWVGHGVSSQLYPAYVLVMLMAASSPTIAGAVGLTSLLCVSYAGMLALVGPVKPDAFLLIPTLLLGAALFGGKTGIAQSQMRRRSEKEEAAKKEGQTDTLTRLPNRAGFLDRVKRSIVCAKKNHDFHFAVIFLDLDGFKPINDKLGHKAGDAVLVETARRLEVCLRKGDMVARYGGDEFTLIVDNVTGRSDAVRVAERILKKIQEPIVVGRQKVQVGSSIGIALSTNVHERPEDLIRDADLAMYRVKKEGKGRYEFSDQIRDTTLSGGLAVSSLE
jgi:diguanylate cyclase (GGDEF)-like protein